MEKEEILDREYEYICDLYNDNMDDMPVITPASESPITYREAGHALMGVPIEESRLQTKQPTCDGLPLPPSMGARFTVLDNPAMWTHR